MEIYLKHSCIDQYHPFPLDKHECHPGPKHDRQHRKQHAGKNTKSMCMCVDECESEYTRPKMANSMFPGKHASVTAVALLLKLAVGGF